MRTRLLTLALGLLVASVIPSAHADGLPVEGVDASLSGVSGTAPGSPRYVTLPAEQGTVVAAVDVGSGQILRSRYLTGRFTVPVVAYDASASGLSADGTTLVLIRPRVSFPRRVTTFAVIEAKRLRPRDVFTLPGDFSFDAVSPDGRWLYLVQYLSKRDPSRYLVRLYDLRRGRLLPEPIIDPREVGDVMRGMPITRATSPDGRWAYTLYDGAGEHPFIHALDTVGRTARCIDLHGLMGFDLLNELRLEPSPGGAALSVVHPAFERPRAVVDTTTWQVSEPEAPGQPEPASRATPTEDGDAPFAPVAAIAAAVLLVLFGLQRLLRRRDSRASEPTEVLRGAAGLSDLLLDDAPGTGRTPAEAAAGRKSRPAAAPDPVRSPRREAFRRPAPRARTFRNPPSPDPRGRRP
jgi:hypothetical protein